MELLSFPEIAGIFEEMSAIHFSDYTSPNSVKVNISKAELGYMRVYDPGTDSRHGLLVPVWDFFGGFDIKGEEYESKNSGEHSNQSFLTVNAVDGTVIDRGLGY